jgi:phosphoribosylglycinamide formyltransferase-1
MRCRKAGGSMRARLAVLASGRGSNFTAIYQAIEQGTLDADIALLLSDREDAGALAFAEEHGIPHRYIPYDRKNRTGFEQAAKEAIEDVDADLVILAGFMRLITPLFIQAFEGRILNIHPSLLPAFKGLRAQKQALDYGVKIAGCTVHVVTQDMDAGPILGQRAVPVLDGDTEDRLADRILEQEHLLYPEMIKQYSERLDEPRSRSSKR